MEVIKIRLWLARSRVVGRQWSGEAWRTIFIILYTVAYLPTRVVNWLFPVLFGEIGIILRNLVRTVYTTFNILFCHTFQYTAESYSMGKDNTSDPHSHLGIGTACIRACLF